MDIRPFRGWRYSAGKERDVTNLIAPPYDVLGRQEVDELLARSERNIVTVDVPHFPPKEVGPPEAYQRAAEILNDWKSSGVIGQEESPALYAYEQTYSWAGKSYTRRAMLCGVRATELGEDVIPHEHTFAGPKADRLKLTETTRMQLSPILAFFRDPQSTVSNLLWAAAEGPAALEGRLRDVTEKLWVVQNEGVIAEITSALRDIKVFIADGHHRYTTAMNYANALRNSGQIDNDHEANFVMFALVGRDDPGLLVLPTHRIVRGLKDSFSIPALIDRLPEFTWSRYSVEDADLSDADAFLHKYGAGAMAFLGADPAEIWIGKLDDPKAMEAVAGDQSEAWRKLDVAILHKLVIDRALDPWRTDDMHIDYTPDGRAVLASCLSGRTRLGICLQGTPVEAVETIALARAVMPHKSTYFYPKVATGMVLKPLD
ncbi:MAG: DUF1015 domain-containing protein [Planctomycetota bacterium]|jgi:uncharacterized protein (DUF1015 family)